MEYTSKNRNHLTQALTLMMKSIEQNKAIFLIDIALYIMKRIFFDTKYLIDIFVIVDDKTF